MVARCEAKRDKAQDELSLHRAKRSSSAFRAACGGLFCCERFRSIEIVIVLLMRFFALALCVTAELADNEGIDVDHIVSWDTWIGIWFWRNDDRNYMDAGSEIGEGQRLLTL